MTERYQDYVIKGGQFVGKFEEMYQKFDDPWEQKAAAVSYVRHSTLFTLEYLQAKKVLEIGCGLGYFSHYIHEHLPYLQLTGMDISSTAVQKAKAKFPELSFVEGDVMREIPPCPRGGGICYDTLLLSEIMWYILEGIDAVLANIRESGAKYLIVNQTFYKGGQKYGTDFFTTPEEMTKFLPFKLLVSESVNIETKGSYDAHMVYEVADK